MRKIYTQKAVALSDYCSSKRHCNYSWSDAVYALDCRTKTVFPIHRSNIYCDVKKNEVFEYEIFKNIYSNNYSVRKATGVFLLPRKKKLKRNVLVMQHINKEVRRYSRPIWIRMERIYSRIEKQRHLLFNKMNEVENVSEITKIEDRLISLDIFARKIKDHALKCELLAIETLQAIYDIEPRAYQ